MCATMKNCNGHGVCLGSGICKCYDTYGFENCMFQAVDINTTQLYTIGSRGYKFFKIPFDNSDVLVSFKLISLNVQIKIQGDNGTLEGWFTGSKNGPVNRNYMEMGFTPTKGINERSFYVSFLSLFIIARSQRLMFQMALVI